MNHDLQNNDIWNSNAQEKEISLNILLIQTHNEQKTEKLIQNIDLRRIADGRMGSHNFIFIYILKYFFEITN